MDWDFAIERNREALKRVLLALVAMAGLAGADAGSPSPLWGRGAAAAGRPRAMEMALGATSARSHAEGQVRGGGIRARITLPRHLHRAVLRLLRPAEAAARRLVIMAARGLVVTLPPPRPRKPKPKQPPFRPGFVTGIWMPPHLPRQAERAPPALRACALPLFDPLPRMRGRKRTASGVPRLCTPGWSAPLPVPPERRSKGRRPPSPDDRLDALRLALRLQALGRALDDLPREAKRFARWRMRRDAETRREKDAGPARPRRLWPLKPGRPPGAASRPVHPVHDLLRDTHALALQALESPDTS